MQVYAGIDEAGYGPLLGPLVVCRSVLAFGGEQKVLWDKQPDVWQVLEKAVCKKLVGRKGRVTVGDSKRLITKAAGIKHLETGVLCFARLLQNWAELNGEANLGTLLDMMGEKSHRSMAGLHWYQEQQTNQWDALPTASTDGEIAIAAGMLRREMQHQQVTLLDLAPALVLEDRFNQMASATRNKASTSFTFVAGHLHAIWKQWGAHHPVVTVDRQGGRTRYLRVLSVNFPAAAIRILDESAERSAYQLTQGQRQMSVTFETKGEEKHFPIALASMLCKYLRELFMMRMNRFFAEHVEGLKPTAGYTQDGRRWLDDVRPHLERIGICEEELIRVL